jgi:hypothetical protein
MFGIAGKVVALRENAAESIVTYKFCQFRIK